MSNIDIRDIYALLHAGAYCSGTDCSRCADRDFYDVCPFNLPLKSEYIENRKKACELLLPLVEKQTISEEEFIKILEG